MREWASMALIAALALALLLGNAGCTPKAAEFQVISLVITPPQVVAGESVIAEADVRNVGEREGIYEAKLKVDGQEAVTAKISVPAGGIRTLSVTYEPPAAGTYKLELGELSRTIKVLRPATFEVGSLVISPTRVAVGETATVSVDVANTGEVAGTYVAELTVDGETVQTKRFAIEAGTAETVSLVYEAEAPGSYAVCVGGLRGTVKVLQEAPMLAYYYLWYGQGLSHPWPRFAEMERKPLLGAYESRNPEVVEKHIRWAKLGSIDGFVLSWWGKDGSEAQTADSVFAAADGMKDFKCAVMIEKVGDWWPLGGFAPADFDDPEYWGAFLQEIGHILDAYVSHPSYLRWEGKPVIMVYAQWNGGILPEAGDESEYARWFNRLKQEVMDEYGIEVSLWGVDMVDCDAWDVYTEYNPYIWMDEFDPGEPEVWIHQKGNIKVGSVIPGFKPSPPWLDILRRDDIAGRTIEPSAALYFELLRQAREARCDVIFITSWNEWAEGTAIESSIPSLGVIEPLIDYEKQLPHLLKSQAHESALVAPGDTITILHVNGVGVVRQIFLAVSSDAKALVEDETWIRVFVNGQDTPSISCPLSQFFAYTFEAEPFFAQRFAMTRKDYRDGDGDAHYDRGMYRYLDMPFANEVRIVLDVGSSGTYLRCWSIVYYHEHELPSLPEPGRDAFLKANYFENLSIAPYSSVELLDIEGRGRLDTLVMSIESPDGLQVCEGNLEIYRDGETSPSFYATGTEDFVGAAFYYGGGAVIGPYQGAPVHEGGPPAKVTQYRVFELDRLAFEQSLRIVWYAGHKGQGPAMTQAVKCRATSFYYLDTQPSQVQETDLELRIEEKFESYGEGNEIGSPWVQRTGVSKWRQLAGKAVYDDTGVFDAWMYRSDTGGWTDYVVEAEVEVNNFGAGEVWLFARGTDSPDFANRIAFGFSAMGAEPELPNYTPVMMFVASGTVRDSSLLLVRGGEKNTLRLEVCDELVVVSIKRSVDSDFRELFRFTQTSLNSGFAGLSAVSADVEVDAFRVYRRAQ